MTANKRSVIKLIALIFGEVDEGFWLQYLSQASGEHDDFISVHFIQRG